MKNKSKPADLNQLKKLVIDNPGILSIDIIKTMNLDDQEIKGSGTYALKQARCKLQEEGWLFIQADSKFYRWYESGYAEERHLPYKIHTEGFRSKKCLSGEELESCECIRMMKITDKLFKTPSHA